MIFDPPASFKGIKTSCCGQWKGLKALEYSRIIFLGILGSGFWKKSLEHGITRDPAGACRWGGSPWQGRGHNGKEDLTPTRPNLRKALLRSFPFSMSNPKSLGGVSWFFPKPLFSFKKSLNHFLSRFWCISAKCSISLLNDLFSFAPISGERLKKDRSSLLNFSSGAFPFSRLSLNRLRVSLFEGTRCLFTALAAPSWLISDSHKWRKAKGPTLTF